MSGGLPSRSSGAELSSVVGRDGRASRENLHSTAAAATSAIGGNMGASVATTGLEFRRQSPAIRQSADVMTDALSNFPPSASPSSQPLFIVYRPVRRCSEGVVVGAAATVAYIEPVTRLTLCVQGTLYFRWSCGSSWG